jgi:hypothetical protein
MSLKAIRELAEAARDGRPVVSSMGVDALAEIAALEKAAPVALAAFTGDIHVFKSDRLDQCVAVLTTIAKEAE